MILENPSWSFILISFEEPSFITNTALGVIFPPTPPPALVSFEKVPTPIPKKNEPRKDYGFVAISVGEGLDEIFKGLGVDYIISGGQTMNPSTEDILEAVDKINADTIFVLPVELLLSQHL